MRGARRCDATDSRKIALRRLVCWVTWGGHGGTAGGGCTTVDNRGGVLGGVPPPTAASAASFRVRVFSARSSSYGGHSSWRGVSSGGSAPGMDTEALAVELDATCDLHQLTAAVSHRPRDSD